MAPTPSLTELLLQEMARGQVVPERYSRRSAYGRVEPLFVTAVLAVAAILVGMALGGACKPEQQARLPLQR